MLQTLLFKDTSSKQKQIGNLGERIAKSYLKKRGWRIVATNLRYGKDELDILGMPPSGNTLAIVEVRSTKSRTRNPVFTLTQRKRRAMARIARKVQCEATKHWCELRFDLITVKIYDETTQIRHYKGILPLKEWKISA